MNRIVIRIFHASCSGHIAGRIAEWSCVCECEWNLLREWAIECRKVLSFSHMSRMLSWSMNFFHSHFLYWPGIAKKWFRTGQDCAGPWDRSVASLRDPKPNTTFFRDRRSWSFNSCRHISFCKKKRRTVTKYCITSECFPTACTHFCTYVLASRYWFTKIISRYFGLMKNQ